MQPLIGLQGKHPKDARYEWLPALNGKNALDGNMSHDRSIITMIIGGWLCLPRNCAHSGKALD